MKCSDYIAEYLSKHTKHVFNGSGGVILHILDSLGKRDDIKLIPTENEQGASIAAEAYSRLTGFGVCVATSGPGFLNIVQGMACAYYDSIPMLFIIGASPTSQLRKKHDMEVRQIGFQEMDVLSVVKTMTKYAKTIKDPLTIKYELDKCMLIAKEDRPGPVVLEIPDDLQRAEIKENMLYLPDKVDYCGSKELFELATQAFLKPKLNKMFEMINESNRPVIIAGAGIKHSHTEKETKRFIDLMEIPVLPTWACADLFPNSPLFGISSSRAGNFAIQNADLIISLGSRLDTHLTGNISKFAPNARIIAVDVDPYELSKDNGLRIDLKIHCNLIKFYKEILKC